MHVDIIIVGLFCFSCFARPSEKIGLPFNTNLSIKHRRNLLTNIFTQELEKVGSKYTNRHHVCIIYQLLAC